MGVLLVLIGVLVREFVALPLIGDHVRELAANQQQALATYVARDIDYAIATRQALIAQLASDLPAGLIKEPQKLRSWIKDRQHTNPAFNGGLLVVRADGNGLLAVYTSISERAELNYRESDWFQAALHGSKPVMSRPAHYRTSRNPAIFFATPVRDGAGSVMAVIAGVALLNTPGFLDTMQEIGRAHV